MRILDLFCCAGGAAVGYNRAGFEVVGVDIKPQPHYPFPFVLMDALEAMRVLLVGGCILDTAYREWRLSDFDAIHASPPCQGWSRCTPVEHRGKHAKLIEASRNLVAQSNVPYVIENVQEARWDLNNPIMLCGGMFGLPIHRHRYFEIHPELPFVLIPPCGVDGETVYITGTPRPADGIRKDPPAAVKRAAMDTAWMTIAEMDEAIPPAYTEFIGRQLIAALEVSG